MEIRATQLQDRIFYDDILPPTGSQQISFARLLQLLQDRRVKRITMLADGKVAIVEVGQLQCITVRLASHCRPSPRMPVSMAPLRSNTHSERLSHVQVPVEGFATDWEKMRYDRNDFRWVCLVSLQPSKMATLQ
jgi:hypothetical protein